MAATAGLQPHKYSSNRRNSVTHTSDGEFKSNQKVPLHFEETRESDTCGSSDSVPPPLTSDDEDEGSVQTSSTDKSPCDLSRKRKRAQFVEFTPGAEQEKPSFSGNIWFPCERCPKVRTSIQAYVSHKRMHDKLEKPKTPVAQNSSALDVLAKAAMCCKGHDEPQAMPQAQSAFGQYRARSAAGMLVLPKCDPSSTKVGLSMHGAPQGPMELLMPFSTPTIPLGLTADGHLQSHIQFKELSCDNQEVQKKFYEIGHLSVHKAIQPNASPLLKDKEAQHLAENAHLRSLVRASTASVAQLPQLTGWQQILAV